MAQYSMRQFHCHSTVIQDRLKIGQKYSIVPSARGRVSERASQRTNAAARERSERVSEWCERTSERMSKWLITNRWREIETHTHRNIHTNKSFFFLLFESRELSFLKKIVTSKVHFVDFCSSESNLICLTKSKRKLFASN